MLSKIKTVKTEQVFIERGSIHITPQHIDSINRKIKHGCDEHELKNQKAVEEILDKTYK